MEQSIPLMVNGESREIPLAGDTVFIEVMRAVNRAASQPGQSVTRIHLNGEDITGQDWDGFADLTVEDIRSLEVETRDLKELARETLVSLDEYIAKVLSDLDRASELFRTGEDRKGAEVYGTAVGGLKVIIYTLQLVQRHLDIDAEAKQSDGNSVKERQRRFEAIITDMLMSQEDRDPILLADLIEYELIPHLTETRAIIADWQNVSA